MSFASETEKCKYLSDLGRKGPDQDGEAKAGEGTTESQQKPTFVAGDGSDNWQIAEFTIHTHGIGRAAAENVEKYY